MLIVMLMTDTASGANAANLQSNHYFGALATHLYHSPTDKVLWAIFTVGFIQSWSLISIFQNHWQPHPLGTIAMQLASGYLPTANFQQRTEKKNP